MNELQMTFATLIKSATFDELVELGGEFNSLYAAGLMNTDTDLDWAAGLNDIATSLFDQLEIKTESPEQRELELPIKKPTDARKGSPGEVRASAITQTPATGYRPPDIPPGVVIDDTMG